MARVDEKQVAVARVYSRAMLELAEQSGRAEALLEEMQALAGLLEKHPPLREFMVSPLVAGRERAQALERQFRGRFSDLLVNSLQVLNKNGRLGLFETLAEVYRSEYQERHGQIDVRVTTAVPLSDDLRRELETVAERIVGRQPNLIAAVDESLIGGLVLQIGDRKIDTSVARSLRKLRKTLSERASQEIYASRAASAQ